MSSMIRNVNQDDSLSPHLASPGTHTLPPSLPSTGSSGAGVVRCGEHSDYGSLTLLLQDSAGGLEVRGADGRWVQAQPVPGTILVRTLQFFFGLLQNAVLSDFNFFLLAVAREDVALVSTF